MKKKKNDKIKYYIYGLENVRQYVVFRARDNVNKLCPFKSRTGSVFSVIVPENRRKNNRGGEAKKNEKKKPKRKNVIRYVSNITKQHNPARFSA